MSGINDDLRGPGSTHAWQYLMVDDPDTGGTGLNQQQ